ncbi:GGDEF domain-containing protein [Deinococcus sp. KSM4-11]|uniref:GGDEF domain-containing protein n=1 Tax=Deinococcus sp. KSM4-11 TaxID=2568654 RepID=UPI0010A4B1B2|nr:GGDEF domain-containing protein [Deinococcus sp. KSM4-11]THF87174.1 GGDEF domain-containing protein [Deinococcus sp. KSM4-11]
MPAFPLEFTTRIPWASAAEMAVVQRLAITDPLTGLDNRRAALERLTSAFNHRSPLSAVLVDVDHFKDVNDIYGHDVGDEVLRSVARALRLAAGRGGHVARWGGEEFLVTLIAGTQDQIGDVAEHLRAAVSQMATEVPQVTVSIGAARPEEATTVREVLKLADARLYQAKAGGRDRVESGTTAGPDHLRGHPQRVDLSA